ncbi:MAG: putative dehydrogenase [Pontimonas sp.]|jgi:predicted dehydrogenase
MVPRVKVIGAGSIGNHLAHGCRTLGMDVTIVDLSSDALSRTREVIYPTRYGAWDEEICLATPAEVEGESFDVIIVGTPPATHLAIATSEMRDTPPKLLLIEKPLSHPDAAAVTDFRDTAGNSATRVLVGYNQRLKTNTEAFLRVATDLELGALTGLTSHMLESWDGILKAHFWMTSEKDSYLAFTDQGGGALLEHSHALNLFLYFAAELGQGGVTHVEADMDWVSHETGRYDRDVKLQLTLSSGLMGEVRQDLHTWPAKKEAVAVFEKGSLVWSMGDKSDSVTHLDTAGTEIRIWSFPKTRPDDFIGELQHLQELLNEPSLSSPLDLQNSLDVMDVIFSALESSSLGARVPLSAATEA